MDLLKQEQFQYQMLKKAIINCIVEDYGIQAKIDLKKLVTILSVTEPIYVLQVEEKIKEVVEGEE
jgi:hypothetical protein